MRRVEVGVNVAGRHALDEQLFVAALGHGRKVDHGDGIAQTRRIDAALCRFPSRAVKVGRLGANGVLGILLDHVGTRLWDHLVDVLLARTGHAGADDIDKRQHARG